MKFDARRPPTEFQMPGFDPIYYLCQYPDVRSANIDPFHHYHHHGWREGRDPSGGFSTVEYLKNNPDVAEAGVNPLLHFLDIGLVEGRTGYTKESGSVQLGQKEDTQKSLHSVAATNQDLLHGYIDEIDHYCVRGWAVDPDAIDDSVEVKIVLNGQVIAKVNAKDFRPDLKEAGVGNGKHGFEYFFQPALEPKITHQISIKRALDDFEIGHGNLEPLELREQVWTSTFNTRSDKASIPKIIRYRGIYYYSCAINSMDDISPRDSTFIYPAFMDRIDVDRKIIETTLADIAPYTHDGAIESVPAEKTSNTTPYWNNNFFSYADARVAVGLTAAYKPRKIIELGSGNSSKFFRLAIQAYSPLTKLISIDPHPRADISKISDEIHYKSVFEVSTEVFAALDPGDFLFWDGSHVVGNGSDITRLFLEIIPTLKKGVYVHIHDVSLPYEGFQSDLYGDYSFPEQYVLGSYLLASTSATIILPNHYLSRDDPRGGGSSFWFIV